MWAHSTVKTSEVVSLTELDNILLFLTTDFFNLKLHFSLLSSRGLHSRARFERDETGTHFPNWQYQDETYVFWSCHSRKFGKNPGNERDEMGLLYTVREIPKQYRISILFWENLNKPQPGFFLFGTVNIIFFRTNSGPVHKI